MMIISGSCGLTGCIRKFKSIAKMVTVLKKIDGSTIFSAITTNKYGWLSIFVYQYTCGSYNSNSQHHAVVLSTYWGT